jgi:hypothetical protein
MSRSYRKPYSAITGTSSAADDKRVARRGVRRRQNQYLRESFLSDDWDDFIMPHKYECSFNETYSWHRDGKQTLQSPPGYPTSWVFLFGEESADERYQQSCDWYQRLHRK